MSGTDSTGIPPGPHPLSVELARQPRGFSPSPDRRRPGGSVGLRLGRAPVNAEGGPLAAGSVWAVEGSKGLGRHVARRLVATPSRPSTRWRSSRRERGCSLPATVARPTSPTPTPSRSSRSAPPTLQGRRRRRTRVAASAGPPPRGAVPDPLGADRLPPPQATPEPSRWVVRRTKTALGTGVGSCVRRGDLSPAPDLYSRFRATRPRM